MKLFGAFRNVMAWKPIRLLVAATALPALVLAASPAASSASGQYIKETWGKYFVAAPTIDLYYPVVETAFGREFYINLAGNGEKFQFVANRQYCVAASDNGVGVVIHYCSGGNGVIWIEHQGNSGTYFESNEFRGRYLSGDNKKDQFKIEPKGASGWYQQFAVGLK